MKKQEERVIIRQHRFWYAHEHVTALKEISRQSRTSAIHSARSVILCELARFFRNAGQLLKHPKKTKRKLHFKKYFLLYYMYVCIYVWKCTQRTKGSVRSPEATELQAVVSHLTWVFFSSEKTASSLNCWAFSSFAFPWFNQWLESLKFFIHSKAMLTYFWLMDKKKLNLRSSYM